MDEALQEKGGFDARRKRVCKAADAKRMGSCDRLICSRRARLCRVIDTIVCTASEDRQHGGRPVGYCSNFNGAAVCRAMGRMDFGESPDDHAMGDYVGADRGQRLEHGHYVDSVLGELGLRVYELVEIIESATSEINKRETGEGRR